MNVPIEYEIPPELPPLDVDSLGEFCSLDVGHLGDCARQALAEFGASPRSIRVLCGAVTRATTIRFSAPDERLARTYQRPHFVEFGAVGVSARVVPEVCGLRVVRVVPRGTNVDYFVGGVDGRETGVLEVGGTDDGSVDALRAEKREQMEGSRYRRAPFWMRGYVSVTRFADPATTALDGYHSNEPRKG